MSDFSEKDWKWLRALKPVLLDRLCERILHEAITIANAPDATPHQRYLKLYRFLQDKDDDVARAFDDHRRSTAFARIVAIHALGLFTEEELAGFSEQTRRSIHSLDSFRVRQRRVQPSEE